MTRNAPLSCEGIVLRATPHKDDDRLLTLFTPQGLLKLYVRGIGRSSRLIPLTTPFARAEYIYLPGRSDLHTFREGSLIDIHPDLRNRFENLETAERLSQALLSSAWPGNAAPEVYALFALLLKRLPEHSHPISLIAPFLLKLLMHEGLLHVAPSCSTCHLFLEETYRVGGEAFCKDHAPPEPTHFSKEENALLQALASTRSWQALLLPLDPLFSAKVERLYAQAVTWTN